MGGACWANAGLAALCCAIIAVPTTGLLREERFFVLAKLARLAGSIAKLLPQKIFYVTDMRIFPNKIVPKQFIHVILGIAHENVSCAFREVKSASMIEGDWEG